MQILMSLCTQARVCPFLQNSFGRCYVDITGDQVHPIEVERTWSGLPGMVSDGVEGALAGARIRAEGVRAWAEGARAG